MVLPIHVKAPRSNLFLKRPLEDSIDIPRTDKLVGDKKQRLSSINSASSKW
jgi:hypothetical protein